MHPRHFFSSADGLHLDYIPTVIPASPLNQVGEETISLVPLTTEPVFI